MTLIYVHVATSELEELLKANAPRYMALKVDLVLAIQQIGIA